MPFENILKDLCGRAGAEGAIMLDHDGEKVASWSRDEGFDTDLIGAHHGVILSLFKEASARSGLGAIESLCVTTLSFHILIIPLKEGYYLLLAASREGIPGKAIFEARKAKNLIESAMD